MTDRELMQQALEAMGTVGADWICEASHHAKKDQHKLGEPCPLQQRWHIAYQALRERLAQPEQKRPQMRRATREEKIDRPGVYWVPVEQPEQKRPQNCGTSYCSCVECVMEPNTKVNSEAIPKQISEPEQEPVAWLYRDSWGTMKLSQVMPPPVGAFPVYTTPLRREWVGLGRKEMLAIIDQQEAYKTTGLPMFYRDQCLDMARAIEAKLREKNA